jgi:hypothetical protein
VGVNDEKQQLQNSLGNQRAHVLGILEDLPEEMLRKPVLPSNWNCVSLVMHLALEVEHYWFRCIVGGESLDSLTTTESGAVWPQYPDRSVESVFALYKEESALADAIIARTSLDAAPAQRDTWWGEWQVPDLRFIMLHAITETACHAGHADAVRESFDGRQWSVL